MLPPLAVCALALASLAPSVLLLLLLLSLLLPLLSLLLLLPPSLTAWPPAASSSAAAEWALAMSDAKSQPALAQCSHAKSA